MRTNRLHSCVAAFVGAAALLVQISPALASDDKDNNRPVEITFTKWAAPAPSPLPPPPPGAPPDAAPRGFFGLLTGFAGDGIGARSSGRFSGDKRA